MEWTVEREGQLRHLWEQTPLSSSEIAREMGEGLTRSAVIGKVNRMKLSKRKPTGGRKKGSHNAPRAIRRTPIVARRLKPAPVPIEIAISFVPPEEQRCSILDLTATTCRWPYGDPSEDGFYFCGGDVVEGHPYCPTHCRMAYNRPEKAAGAIKTPRYGFGGQI